MPRSDVYHSQIWQVFSNIYLAGFGPQIRKAHTVLSVHCETNFPRLQIPRLLQWTSLKD